MKTANIILVLIFVSMIVSSIAVAADEGFVEKRISDTTAGSDSLSVFELVKDWRILSLIVIMLTGALVSLAIMFGKSFEMPDLIAWGNTELTQIFATAMIILLIIPIVSFLDYLLVDVVNSSNVPGLSCNLAENCAVKTADAYINNIIDSAKKSSSDILEQAESAGQKGTQRVGGFGTSVILPPLLQASYSTSPSAGYMIYLDRYNVVLEHFGTIFVVLISQQFFISQIVFKIAPAILLLGIVLRSFFVTRKVGGLMMAIGIGVLYVLPLMYVFDWYTLNITLYGDSSAALSNAQCPVECKLSPPIAYSSDSTGLKKYSSASDIFNQLGMDISDPAVAAAVEPSMADLTGVIDGSKERAVIGSTEIISCENTSYTSFGYCPKSCRERPYPLSQECTSYNETSFIEKACNYVKEECVVIRLAQRDPVQEARCKPECQTIPPLKINCDNQGTYDGKPGSCLLSKHYCRAARYNSPDDRFVNCEESITITDDDNPDESYQFVLSKNAWACPASTTASQSCVYVLPNQNLIDSNACKSCLFVPQTYTFNPPVQTNCADLCGRNNGGPPKVSPVDFAQITKEGMVGPPDVKNAASLILPAYILPLLNIAVTLMFIRSLSVMLGGDIEIPGVSKIL